MAGALVGPRRVRGQVLVFVALALTALLMLVMAAISYGTLTWRTMRALTAANLAAHAGTMEVRLLPDGRMVPNGRGPQVAALVFARNQPTHTTWLGATCGLIGERPYCEVRVRVKGAFWAPDRIVRARAVLAWGVTRENQ